MECATKEDFEKINSELISLKKEVFLLKEFLNEDLEFFQRSEEALKRVEAGEFISVDSENLFEEMNKW